MAIATYDSDLTSANGGELTIASNAANWSESSDGGWDDAGSMVDETNFFIQGSECISAQFTKTGVGTIIFIGSTFTVDTDGAILIWSFWASPSSLTTYASGGVRTIVGDGLGAFEAFKASGSDFDPNPIGGWANYAVDPNVATVDATVGAPTTFSHVGIAINATAQSRGNPHAVDAIRVGRCTLEIIDGQAAAYGTFSGMADFDNSSGQRYALFQTVFGGFKWKGLMSLGVSATAVDFRDSNANIFVDNVPQVSAAFNRIEVNNAASNVEWTSISISAQDGLNNPIAATASVGEFECVDNATVVKTSCTFTDMNTFDYLSNSTLEDNIYRRCGIVTQGGATFTGNIFDSAIGTQALLSTAATLNLVTGNSFISSGAGYAVELGTTSDSTTISWDNTDSGYAATDGVTGNETIHITYNGGSTKDISVAAGASTPTVHNDGTGTVTVTAGLLTIRVTVTDASGTPIENARVEIRATETVGTVTTGDVILTGLTNASGIIEDVGFVYEAAFDPSGLDISIKARQGSVSPFKVPSTTAGTIVSVSGFSTIIALQPDE